MSLAELFYAKQAHRARSMIPRCRPSRHRNRPAKHRKFLLEPLEPRLLLSGSPLSYAAAGAALDLTLRLATDALNPPILKLIDNASGAEVKSQALADTSAVEVEGSDDADRLVMDASVPVPLPVTFAGRLGPDRLVGLWADSLWHITGRDAGTVSSVAFSGVENLSGGTGADTFVFDDAASVSGSIAGAGGTNTLDYAAYTSDVTVNLETGDATGTGGTSDIQQVLGGQGADTLIGPDAENLWTLTGADAGTVGEVNFSGVENLTGGDGADTFVVTEGSSLTGVLDGGGGPDTLVGADTDNTWTISGADAGTLNGLSFSGVENLQGGAGQDTFVFVLGGSLSGVLAGGVGPDTLVGADTPNTWRLTGADAGTLNGQPFSGIENLVGGAHTDTFLFAGGRVSGTIDGGAGSNIFDYSAQASGVAIDLGAGTATGTGGLSNVQTIVGSGGSDTVVGPASDTTWIIQRPNAGNVAGTTFRDIEHVTGGAGADTFVFEVGASLAGSVVGGLGDDTLVGPDTPNAWEIAGADAGRLNGVVFASIESLLGGAVEDAFVFGIAGRLSGLIDGRAGVDRVRGADKRNRWRLSGSGTATLDDERLSGVERLEGGSGEDEYVFAGSSVSGVLDGGAGSDTLIGPAEDTTWSITGPDAGTLAGVSFTGVESLTGAPDNADTFVVGPGGGLSGLIQGGAGGFDTLVVEGGEYDRVTFAATGPDSGSVVLGDTVISYAGLEPIDVRSGSADVVIDLGLLDGPLGLIPSDDDATLTAGSAGRLTFFSNDAPASFESVSFNNPARSLTIRLGGGDDTLTIEEFATGLGTSLTVTGEGGNDTIIVAANALVSTRAIAGSDHLGGASTGDSGAITFAAETIDVRPGAKLLAHAVSTSAPGAITLQAEDPTPLSFPFPFVDIVTTAASITLDGATVKGGEVRITATADADRSWDELGPGFDVVIGLLDSLSEFGGVAISNADATITLRGATDIEASTLRLESNALAEANVRAVGVALAVAYGEANPTATVTIGDGVQIDTTGDLIIKTSADSKLNVEAKQSLLGAAKDTADVDVTIAGGVSTIESTAWVQRGAWLDVGGDLTIQAHLTKSLDVSSAAGAYEDGAVGTAVALSGSSSVANALLDGTAVAGGSITIEADSKTTKNDISASAQVGTGVVGGLVIKAKDKVGLARQTGSLFQLISPQPDGRSGATPFALSAAWAWADHTNEALARIGAGVHVSAETGGIDVTASILDLPEITARAFVDSQKLADANQGNTKETSVSTAIVTGNFRNFADAHIGRGAVVDAAQAIAVVSETQIPLVIDWLHFDEVSDLSEIANSNFGIQNGLFTSWAQSNASGTKTALAVSVDVVNLVNTSHAYIGEGAMVNQDPAFRTGMQDVRVEAFDLIEAMHLSGVFGLKFLGTQAGNNGVGGSYLEVDYENAVTARILSGAHVYGDSLIVRADAKTHNFALAEAGGAADNLAVNGAFSLVRVNDRTIAQIDDGAFVTLGSAALAIPRVVRDRFEDARVGLGEVILPFVFGVETEVEDTLLALDTNGDGQVDASDEDIVGVDPHGPGRGDDVLRTNLNQLVVAENESTIINAGGGITKGQSFGVGFSVSINEIDRDTKALIGNRSTGFTPAGVDSDDDRITFDAPHGLVTGDAIVYDAGAGAPVGGLTDGQTYYVIVVDPRTVRLAQSLANAFATTPVAVDLDGTATPSGEEQALRDADDATGALAAAGRVKLAALNHGEIFSYTISGAATTQQSTGTSLTAKEAPKGSGKYGIGVSVDVSVNTIRDVTEAYVGDSEGSVSGVTDLVLLALNPTVVQALSGSVAISTASGASGTLAGAWTQNTIHGTTRAFIEGSTITLSGDLTLRAETPARIAGNAASLSGAGKIGAAGSVTVNEIDLETLAFVADGSRVTVTIPTLSFDPAVAVDATTGNINLGYAHGLATGDQVVYRNGGGTSIGGLVNGGVYYVTVVNPTTVRLARSPEEATDAAATFFDPATDVNRRNTRINLFASQGAAIVGPGDTLFVADHRLETGDSVVYRSGGGAPIGGLMDGQTYYVIRLNDLSIKLADSVAEAMAGVAITGLDFTVAGATTHVLVAQATGEILLGYDHRFATGDAVVYRAGAGNNAIGGLADGQTYYVIRLNDLSIKLADSVDDALAGQVIETLDASQATGTAHSLRLAVDPTAAVGNAHILAPAGNVTISAVNSAVIRAIAAAPSFGGKAGIGASVAVNTIEGTTKAYVDASDLAAVNDVAVRAVTRAEITAGAAAIGAAQGPMAAAVAVTVNTIRNETGASISGKKLDGVHTTGDVVVNADDSSVIWSVAGNIAVSTGAAGIGVSTAVNVVDNATTASIVGEAVVTSSSGDVKVSASQHAGIPTSPFVQSIIGFLGLPEASTITALAIGGGGANTAGLFGSVAVNAVTNETRAHIGDRAEAYVAGMDPMVTAYRDVVVSADDEVVLFSLAGNVALAGTGALGISSSTIVGTNIVEAWVGQNAAVSAGGHHDLPVTDAGLSVTATSSEDVRNFAVGGGGAGKIGGAGSASVTVLNETTRAFVDRGARINQAGGASDDQSVEVRATDDTTLLGIAGALAGGGTAGIGAGADVAVLTKLTEAFIAASAAVDARNNVVVNAGSTEDMSSISASVGGGGSAGIAGAASVPVLNITTGAFIGPDEDELIPRLSSGTIIFFDGLLFQDFIVRSQGSWSEDGFAAGQSIGVSGSTSNDGAYQIDSISADGRILTLVPSDDLRFEIASASALQVVEQIAAPGVGASLNNGTITFADNEVDPETITRSVGSWIADGFTAGQIITVSGSGSNDGTYRIAEVSEDGLTLTLVPDASLVDEQNDVANVEVMLAPTMVTAEGNVSVSAVGHTEIDLISGNITGAGSVSVGASAAVPIINKTTEAFIGRDAIVDAKGLRDGLDVTTGRFTIGFVQESFSLTELPAPAFFAGGNLDLDVTGDGNADLNEESLTRQRTASAETQSLKGVAVTAINQDDVETVGLSGGGSGAVAVNVGGSVQVTTSHTSAFIDSGARINTDDAGAGNEQSVLVAAGSDYSHMGLAAIAAGAGGVAVTPGADVTVVKGTTEAYVADDAEVQAERDIHVVAHAAEDVLSLSAGVAGSGTVSVGGAVSVIVVNSTTHAHIGDHAATDADGAIAHAGGNILVAATDDTDIDVIAGSLGIGFGAAGVGASVPVTVVNKDTRAWVGTHATVDAGGNAGPLVGIFDGGLTDSDFSTEPAFHGLAVQAASSERLASVAASGAGGFYAGVAGGVSVEVIDSDTVASIGANANVNTDAQNASPDQSVNVSAVNDADVFVVAGGLGIGFVGVGGAVDVGVLRNDTSASIGAGAEVHASRDVDVNALSRKTVDSIAVSAAGGVVGGVGSVSVWAIGSPFDATYSIDGHSGNGLATTGSSGNSPQFTNVPSFTDAMAGGKDPGNPTGQPNNGYAAIIDGYDRFTFDPSAALDATADTIDLGPDHGLSTGDAVVYDNGGRESIGGLTDGQTYYVIIDETDTDHVRLAASLQDALDDVGLDLTAPAVPASGHSLSPLVGNTTAGAGDDVGHAAPQGVVTAATGSTEVSPGTIAFIGSGAVVTAGDDVNVRAKEDVQVLVLTGSAAAGAVGIGGSVTVVNVRSNTLAYIAGDDPSTQAVEAGATVSAGSDTGDDILVEAKLDETVRGFAFAGQAGLVGLGAQVVVIHDTSAQAAYVQGGVEILKADTLEITADGDRFVLANATGGNVGGVAAGASVAVADVGGSTTAFLGGAEVGLAGAAVRNLEITADSSATADVDTIAVAAGIVAGSGSVASATVDPTVQAFIGDGAQILVTDNVLVEARSQGLVTADAGGIGLSGIGVGVSKANATWSPTITAFVGASTSVMAGADISVLASSNHDETGVADPTKLTRANATSASGSLIGGVGAGATATATANVSASIRNGSTLTAGHDVMIRSLSNNITEAEASGKAFAIAGGGITTATSSITNVNHAYTGDNVSITAGRNFTLSAQSTGRAAKSDVTGGAGGILAGASTSATAAVDDQTTVTVGDHSTITAGGILLVEALTSTDAHSKAGIETGAAATLNLTESDTDVTPHIKAAVGTNATLVGNTVAIHAKVTKLDADANAFSMTIAALSTTDAQSLVDVISHPEVIVHSGAKVIGTQRLEIIARQDGVDVDSDAIATIQAGLTGTVRATGHNDLDLDSDVDIRAGSRLVSDNVIVKAESPRTGATYGHTADADAQTIVQTVVETFRVLEKKVSKIPIIGWFVKWITKLVTIVSQVILQSNESAQLTGAFTSDNAINLAGDIFQGASSSPRLVINADGSFDAVGVTAEILGNEVIVSDIAGGQGAGSILLSSPGGAVSGHGTIHKNSNFATVTIVNNSNLNLRINDISSINPNAVDADLQIESDPAKDSSSIGVVSDLGSGLDAPEVTIQNNSTADVLFAGEVENPTGITNVTNQGGDILALPGAFLEGREITLQAPQGQIGEAASRLGLRLYTDESNATLTAAALGGIYLETRLVEISETDTPVSSADIIDGADFNSLVAGGDIDVHAVQSQVLVPSEDPGGSPTLINLNGTYHLSDVTSTGGNVTIAVDSGDLNVGSVHSPLGTATLIASHSIDEAGQDSPADLVARDIVLTAATGGIGTQGNALDIDSGTGLVSASAMQGIYLTETAGDLRLGRVLSTMGNVQLTADGSILDGADDAASDIEGKDVVLTAVAGGVGVQGNPVEIDSGNSSPGLVTVGVLQGVYLSEMVGDLRLDRVASATGDVWLEAAGSILDGETDDASDIDAANVWLSAPAGSIGSGSEAVEIDSAIAGVGLVTASALYSINMAETTGNLTLGRVAAMGEVRLAAVGAIRDDDDEGAIDIAASDAVLDAGSGIGEAGNPGNPLETQLAMLDANAGNGDVWIVNTGALEVGDVTAAGAVSIIALSPLTVSGVVSGANVFLEATDSPGPGDDLTVQSGAMITATTGPVSLIAGDNLTIEAGSVVTSAGKVLLSAGGNVQLAGTVLADSMLITGSAGDNVFAIRQLSTDTVVQTLGGNDTIHVGSNATLTSNTGGNVNAIAALLTIEGGNEAGFDTLTLDDTGDLLANTGTLTQNSLSGLGMGEGLQYAGIENLVVSLGSGGDTFTIDSTHAGATQLAAGPGTDTVNVRTISGDTSLLTGGDGDTINVGSLAPDTLGVVNGIDAQLTIVGEGGADQLNVDDSGDATNNNGTLTGSTLTGLGMGGSLQYAGIEALTIALGAGHDSFNVRGTSADTQLKTGAGDDTVIVSSTASGNSGTLDNLLGALNIDAGPGAHNALNVSDAGDPDADTTVVITSSSIIGLAPAIITYTATGGYFGSLFDPATGAFTNGIEISAGSGGNHITIESTRHDPSVVEVTQVNAGAGDDTVVIRDPNPRYLVVHGQTGDDVLDGSASPGGLTLFGDADDDALLGGSGNDVLFGDQGKVSRDGSYVLTGLDTLSSADDGSDEIDGGSGDDLILGGANSGASADAVYDMLRGGTGNDAILGDYGTVKFMGGIAREIETVDRSQGGNDVLMGDGGEDILLGGAAGDVIDGGDDRDLIFGDNVLLVRIAGSGNAIDPRFRALTGTTIYDTNGVPQVGGQFAEPIQPVPGGRPAWADWTITLDQTLTAAQFGSDYIAGGGGNDEIFGQLGNDTIQGDGSIASKVDSEPATLPVSAARVSGLLHVVPSFEASTDGDDYIEGNGGNDVIFGNLGQDDIIGGSSSLFSLATSGLRPDGADLIFGGAGTDITRNDQGDTAATGHARDADVIAGDNAIIYRLVGVNGVNSGGFLMFNYDNYNTLKIIPRAVEFLDYTPGGPDFNPAGAVLDIGGADEVHGESGDDSIYGIMGDDRLFGDGQDDDLVGGYGHDWISGGTGDDAVLGDDGRIFTSRNGLTEPLNGVTVPAVQQTIDTPGGILESMVNVAGQLKKTVDLTPFNVEAPSATQSQDPLYDAMFADDVIYGGWGDDALHGGSGDDAISGAEALQSFFDAAYNPGNLLRFGEVRAGEFAAYDEFDPWRKVFVNGAGEFDPNSAMPFLLNFDAAEGVNQVGTTTQGRAVWDGDGADRIFGDLGNDWLVGGPGQDHLYGGWGDDLLNADDDHDSTMGGADDRANNTPDTHSTYEDIAYGGAGRDVLIANTGGDRLVDWAGEFNSYLVPFAPFGLFTISRALQPQIAEFFYDLSESDGADQTLGSDQTRNGEPEGELGLVTQRDLAWQDQTGAPDDPQPGNIPGGPRDVLRSADFNTGGMSGFAPDSGSWAVSGNALQVSAASLGGDAVSVYHVEQQLPGYFEIRASVSVVKPTAGWKANSYIIFDYQGKEDFKFAGLDVSLNKLVMGHRDATSWHVDEQAPIPGGVKADKYYNILLAVNGVNAILVMDGKNVFAHTYQPRVLDGYSYGLNWGMVGVGSDNSRGTFDNIAVQILPPAITLTHVESFDDGIANLFTGAQTGVWQVAGGRYDGAPGAGADRASSLLDLGVPGLQTSSYLELSATLRAQGLGGVIFDQYGPDDFKFAAIDAQADQVVIGHYTARRGWVRDAVASRLLDGGTDYKLDVSLKGTTVSVSLNGQAVLGHVFNGVVVDGGFGVLAGAATSVDSVTVKTDDRAFAQPVGGSNLVAASAPFAPVGGASLTQGELDAITAQAIGRWSESLGSGDARLSALGNFHVSVADLPDPALGFTQGNRVLIDADAAGHGWFIDGGATSGMDLLTVVMHELGHRLGFEHSEAEADDLMGATLGVGERHLLEASGGDRTEEGSEDRRGIGSLFARGEDSITRWFDEGSLIRESRLEGLFGWLDSERKTQEPIASIFRDGAGRLIDWEGSAGRTVPAGPVAVGESLGQGSSGWLRRFLLELGEEDPNLAIEVTIPAEVA